MFKSLIPQSALQTADTERVVIRITKTIKLAEICLNYLPFSLFFFPPLKYAKNYALASEEFHFIEAECLLSLQTQAVCGSRSPQNPSKVLSLPSEPQWPDSWLCFDCCSPHSSLLITVPMFVWGCLHLFISASAVCRSRKHLVPRAGSTSYHVQFRPCAGTSRHKWQRNDHCPPAKELGTSLLDTFPSS